MPGLIPWPSLYHPELSSCPPLHPIPHAAHTLESPVLCFPERVQAQREKLIIIIQNLVHEDSKPQESKMLGLILAFVPSAG